MLLMYHGCVVDELCLCCLCDVSGVSSSTLEDLRMSCVVVFWRTCGCIPWFRCIRDVVLRSSVMCRMNISLVL